MSEQENERLCALGGAVVDLEVAALEEMRSRSG